MRTTYTSTQLSILRCAIQRTQLYLAVHRPQTLFTSRLSAVPDFPADTLSFSSGSPTTGTVPAGTTLYIGSSAGARDKGLLRVRKTITLGATGTISIAETGEKLIALATNDYLTVVEDYRPAPKFPRYDGGAWYMDYDVAYGVGTTIQNDNYGPLARLGPAAVGFIVGGACRLRHVGERSAAYSPGNAVDTWAWEFPDGSTSASEGTTASPITVNYTAALPDGEYHSLTVTEDVTGQTHTGRRLTFVFDRTGSNAPYSAVILNTINGGPQRGGYTVDLRVVNTTADQAEIPDRAHVVVFEEAYFADDAGPWYEITDITDPTSKFIVGNPVVGTVSLATGEIVAIADGYIHIAVTGGEFTPGELIVDDLAASASARIYAPNIGGNYPYRSNVVLEGWIVAETIHKNPETGSIDFTITTLDGVLRTLEGYPVALTNRSTTPTLSWEDAKRLTANTATLHFAKWRSTIADIADLEFQDYAAPDEAIIKYITLDKSSLYDQLNGFWARTLLGWVACDMQGALYGEMDAVIDDTIRAQVPTIWTMDQSTDLRDELEMPRRIINANSQTVLYAVAYRKPLGSKSPGDPHGDDGATVEITEGVAGPLIGGDISQPDQSTLNLWAGNLRAKSNNPYADVPHQLAGNWRVDPVPQCFWVEAFAAPDTYRGIVLTDQKWLPRSIRLAYNSRSYSLLADVNADAETTGLGGVAIDFPEPEEPIIDVPPPPPPPPPIEPLPDADGSEVWLFHHNPASTPVNAIIYSTDYFASPSAPTWQACAALPGDLSYIKGGSVTADGSVVYIAGVDTLSHIVIWKSLNAKTGSPTWTKIVSYGDATGIPGGTGTIENVTYFAGANNGFAALVEHSALGSNGLICNGNEAQGVKYERGQTRTNPDGSTTTPPGLWNAYSYLLAPEKVLMYSNSKPSGFGVTNYPSGDGYANLPDASGTWRNYVGLGWPFGGPTVAPLNNGIGAPNPATLGAWQSIYQFSYSAANIQSFTRSPFGTAYYALTTVSGLPGQYELYYSLNGVDFRRSSSQTWTLGRVLPANLSGGKYVLWVLGQGYYQQSPSGVTVTNGNEFLRYCLDISDVDNNPWTASTGNMWSSIISLGDLTLWAVSVVYAT